MMLAWTLLGVPLAVDKGQLDRVASWVGMEKSIHMTTHPGVLATILEARMEEISSMADDFASRNVVPIKELRTFTGKCPSVAG